MIDCQPTSKDILKALEHLYSAEFQQVLKSVKNPYGTGGASDAIAKILADHPLENILKKQFYNLPVVDRT